MFSIRTTYPDRICYRSDGVAPDNMAVRVLLGNPNGVDSDIALRTPCHLGEGSLHLAHADGPPCYIAPSTRGNPDGVDPDSLARFVSSGIGVPTPCTRRRSPLCVIAQSTRGRIPCADILHPDISQPNGRGGHFNFFRYTYLDLLKAFTRRVFLSVYSAAMFS